MKRHQHIHSGQHPYSGNVCKKNSLRPLIWRETNLYTVVSVLIPVMFVKKTFSQKSNMKSHQLIHSGQRPYACEVCKKKFIRKDDMYGHQVIHSGQRPYAYEVCNKTFSLKCNLKEHLLIHSGQWPCVLCLKTFTENYSLKKRHLIYNGQRPYACDVCKKNIQSEAWYQERPVYTVASVSMPVVCVIKHSAKSYIRRHIGIPYLHNCS